jgi:cysteine synthase
MYAGLIGQTPLFRASHLRTAGGAELLLKLEGVNLTGSLKVRAALEMVRAAQDAGELSAERPLVEPTSGNLGIALAAICAREGIPCHLVVDPRMTAYSWDVMATYGVTVHQVEEPDSRGSWQGSRLALARRIADEVGGHMLVQYDNEANPQAHEQATGPEILADLGQPPDVCVIGVSTGGTVTGVGRALKRAGSTRVIAVDVDGSSIFGGCYRAYRLRGLGLSWWPKNLAREAFDEVYSVSEDVAFTTAQLLAAREGVLTGGSGGAVVAVAAAEAARRSYAETVVAIVAERGDRYLQTVFDPAWRARYGYPDLVDEPTWLDMVSALAPLDLDEHGG